MRDRIRAWTGGGILSVLALAVWWAGPDPASLAPALRHPQAYVDRVGADQAAVTAVSALCWIVLAWLAAGLALTAASALPGAFGRASGYLAGWVLPATVRRAVAVALGLSLVTGGATAAALTAGGPKPAAGSPAASSPVAGSPVAASPAAGSPAAGSPFAASPVTGWPVAGSAVGRLAAHPALSATGAASRAGLGSPTRPVPESPIDLDWPARRAVETGPQTVVVHRGDSLWAIAARRLGPAATAAQIAREWPRWYAANRAVIGPDPDLILPGQRLIVPPALRTNGAA